eukprot:c7179_g1_i1.p1 GENE.c7179_g1_i1~~c7179_g1_i1.p1  ORF type:complete len:308 (+),score=92.77 c7179_g1_i1:53-976(+)
MEVALLIHSVDSPHYNDLTQTHINKQKKKNTSKSSSSTTTIESQKTIPSKKMVTTNNNNDNIDEVISSCAFQIEREEGRKKTKASTTTTYLFETPYEEKLPRLKEIITGSNQNNTSSRQHPHHFLKPAKKMMLNGSEKKNKCRLSLLIKAAEAIEGQDLDQIFTSKKMKKPKKPPKNHQRVSQDIYSLPPPNAVFNFPDPNADPFWMDQLMEKSYSGSNNSFFNPAFYAPIPNSSQSFSHQSQSPSTSSLNSSVLPASSFLSSLSQLNNTSLIHNSSTYNSLPSSFASTYPNLFQSRMDLNHNNSKF